MQLRLIKVALVQIMTIFFLCVLALIGVAKIATDGLESKAEAICDSVPLGSGVDAAIRAIQGADTHVKLKITSPSFPGVAFGGPFTGRWFCSFTVVDGKVVAHEIRYLD